MMNSLEVETTQYEFVHGKRPKGYGMWAFFFDGETDSLKAFWHTGKYSEAKAMAIRWAVVKGHRRIAVGS